MPSALMATLICAFCPFLTAITALTVCEGGWPGFPPCETKGDEPKCVKHCKKIGKTFAACTVGFCTCQ